MKILIVEDSLEMQLILRQILIAAGAELDIAPDLKSARASIEGRRPDLMLLDVNLPDGDGFQFMAEINAKENPVPVIFITGQDEVTSKVAAFSIGAEDYIVKPFNHLEVRARLEAKIRRISSSQNAALIIEEGVLRIDIARQRVYLEGAGGAKETLSLTGKEFQILVLLAKNEGRVLSRNQILDSVWGAGISVLDRTVDTHISALRKKLGAAASYIEAVPGSGYRFSAKSGKAAA